MIPLPVCTGHVKTTALPMSRLLAFHTLLVALAFFAGCATPPTPAEVPQPVPEPARQPPASMSLHFSGITIVGVDIDTVEIALTLDIRNSGETDLVWKSVEWVVDPVPVTTPTTDGRAIQMDDTGRLASCPPVLAGGQSCSMPVSMTIDVPSGAEPLVPMGTDVTVSAEAPDGRIIRATATVTGQIQRILRPQLIIRSIRILKDELINTRLGVDLSIINPNVFPLRFSGLEYRLYGESRYWASGKIAEPFDVPERGEAEARLYLTMNFTDMDRSVLDRVIKLAEVAYRLQGSAIIDTGLVFFPRFEQSFDMSGRVKVIK